MWFQPPRFHDVDNSGKRKEFPHLTNFHIDKSGIKMYHITSAGTGVRKFF